MYCSVRDISGVAWTLAGPQKCCGQPISPADNACGTLIPVLSPRTIIQEHPTLPSTPATGRYDERRGERETGQCGPSMVRSGMQIPLQGPMS